VTARAGIVGSNILHYHVLERLGGGGMGEVYLAEDTRLGRQVALKFLSPADTADPEARSRLVREAQTAALLRSPHIAVTYDLLESDDGLFIAMEYVEGFDLNQLLRALSKAQLALPAEFALFVIREALRALDYAHRVKDDQGRLLGLVHRDVSPSNVLVSFEGEVKLCDFGIARAMSAQDEDEIAVPRVVGKSAYMAPEHARGEPIDARADVFAAGILLWELCAGRRLYRGDEDEMLAQAKQAEVPPLPERGLPEHDRLQAVLDRALARYRDDRFQSAAEFLRALEDYAVQARLMASQLRFGSFLTSHFAQEIVELRRERELSARAYQSEIPPQALAGFDDDVVVTLPTRDASRVWSEPGALDGAAPALDAAATLRDAPPVPVIDAARERAMGVSEVELERSLSGLDLAAQRGSSAGSREAPRVSAPARAEWVWYAAAAAILLLGLLGYVFR